MAGVLGIRQTGKSKNYRSLGWSLLREKRRVSAFLRLYSSLLQEWKGESRDGQYRWTLIGCEINMAATINRGNWQGNWRGFIPWRSRQDPTATTSNAITRKTWRKENNAYRESCLARLYADAWVFLRYPFPFLFTFLFILRDSFAESHDVRARELPYSLDSFDEVFVSTTKAERNTLDWSLNVFLIIST